MFSYPSLIQASRSRSISQSRSASLSRSADRSHSVRRRGNLVPAAWALAAVLGSAATASLAPATAHAESWPSRPVRIVVPYPPGGAVDVVTRRMAAKLQDQLGQSFFVENKPGATGTIGVAQVAKAAPDGYPLVANDTTWALLPHIFKKLPFDYQGDLQPVSAFIFAPMGLVVRGDSKYQALGDLVSDAKLAADKISYGSGGAGTTPHFVGEAFGVATGAKFLHVPFKGAGEATLGLLSGTVDFQFASTPGIMGNVRSGKARVLAVSGEQRAAGLPDVPTFAEAGIRDFGLVNFTGLWAPKSTPAVIVDRLQKEIAKAMASPDMKAFAEGIASEPGYWDSTAFSNDLAARTAFWGRIASNTAFERQ